MLALYQWQVSGQDPAEIGRHFLDDPIWVGEVADSLLAAAEEATQGSRIPRSTTTTSSINFCRACRAMSLRLTPCSAPCAAAS